MEKHLTLSAFQLLDSAAQLRELMVHGRPVDIDQPESELFMMDGYFVRVKLTVGPPVYKQVDAFPMSSSPLRYSRPAK